MHGRPTSPTSPTGSRRWVRGPDLRTGAATPTSSSTTPATPRRRPGRGAGARVDVRGLLWRSHWRKVRLPLGRAFEAGQDLGGARRGMPGTCEFAPVVPPPEVRGAAAPRRPDPDVAYAGGIDLCHSRRDDDTHGGDPSRCRLLPSTARNPAWHDVQVAVRGPAVHDVETTFRERWEDDAPLTSNPGRRFTSWLQAEDQDPDPLGEQWPPPPPVAGATGRRPDRAHVPAAPPGAPRLRARW